MQAKSLHWQAHIVKSYRYSRAKIQIEGKFQMFLYIAELSLQMRFCKRNASMDIYSSSRTFGAPL